MTLRVVLEPAAEAELREAASWYTARSPAVGLSFRRAAAAAFRAIEENPLRFPIVLRDVRKARLRRFPYVVYYVVLPEMVSVIAVIHARRDPRRWQARR